MSKLQELFDPVGFLESFKAVLKLGARLLYAKSKLSTLTVPRKELETVRMMVEAVLKVNAFITLEDVEFVFLTDSTVACIVLGTKHS